MSYTGGCHEACVLPGVLSPFQDRVGNRFVAQVGPAYVVRGRYVETDGSVTSFDSGQVGGRRAGRVRHLLVHVVSLSGGLRILVKLLPTLNSRLALPTLKNEFVNCC